jgi:Aminotransferase class I and II
VLTPAHQWPTGVVLAPERRLALVDWAARRDAVIIEDDYDAEFRYDRDPVGAVQGLAPDRVFSLGTVSKSLAPVLRLGWIACPPRLADALRGIKRVADRGSAGLDQLGLSLLMESGRYDRHLRRMRSEYSARRDVLVRALAEHAPGVRLTGLAAGFHAVVHLPAGVAEQTVIERARARSVGLYGMSSCRSDNCQEPPQLILGFGNTSQRQIKEGIALTGDLLRGLPPGLAWLGLRGRGAIGHGQQVKERTDPQALLRAVPEQVVPVECVPVAAADAAPCQVARGFQVGHDGLDRALGQADHRADVPHARMRVLGDLDQHVPVPGQKRPATAVCAG